MYYCYIFEVITTTSQSNKIKFDVLFEDYLFFLDYIIYRHNTHFHINRIERIKEGIILGKFPVRIHNSTLSVCGYYTKFLP